MRSERSEPILPSRSLDETRAFYKNLGFVSWHNGRGPWEYEIFSRGHLVVHFFLESGLIPGENDTSCYLRVRDADQLYEEFTKLDLPKVGIPRLNPPADQPWGMREFTVVDPSGNLLRIGHDLNADAAYVPSEAGGNRES
jgi:catechol 2,3-dioxygenase-like lactoylglutathione lyase family enzyme